MSSMLNTIRGRVQHGSWFVMEGLGSNTFRVASPTRSFPLACGEGFPRFARFEGRSLPLFPRQGGEAACRHVESTGQPQKAFAEGEARRTCRRRVPFSSLFPCTSSLRSGVGCMLAFVVAGRCGGRETPFRCWSGRKGGRAHGFERENCSLPLLKGKIAQTACRTIREGERRKQATTKKKMTDDEGGI